MLRPQNRTNRSNCDKSMKLSRIEAKVVKIGFHSGGTRFGLGKPQIWAKSIMADFDTPKICPKIQILINASYYTPFESKFHPEYEFDKFLLGK